MNFDIYVNSYNAILTLKISSLSVLILHHGKMNNNTNLN